jgi:hypothetical protein
LLRLVAIDLNFEIDAGIALRSGLQAGAPEHDRVADFEVFDISA